MYYEKAFDSISAAPAMEALKDQGIEACYITLLCDIYKGCTGRIIFHKQGGIFLIRKGIRPSRQNCSQNGGGIEEA